jgi:hypothetical protein
VPTKLSRTNKKLRPAAQEAVDSLPEWINKGPFLGQTLYGDPNILVYTEATYNLRAQNFCNIKVNSDRVLNAVSIVNQFKNEIGVWKGELPKKG